MIRRPPRSTRTDTLFPYPTLFRSHQHALAFECAALKRVAQRGGIQPHAVGGQQFELVAAEAEQLEPLAPRVVRRDRREYQRHLQLWMRGEEADQAALLDAFVLHALQPLCTPDRRLREQPGLPCRQQGDAVGLRSEEHTSELQSLMRPSYAVFCL